MLSFTINRINFPDAFIIMIPFVLISLRRSKIFNGWGS